MGIATTELKIVKFVDRETPRQRTAVALVGIVDDARFRRFKLVVEDLTTQTDTV